mmetsp:Transcript_2908/g.4167  ORF Transcript_2908/g.4167 Transcript_2908/m.4167 type:complete len:317 (+) Transcript_2908:1913-2863(+)
MVFIQIMIVYCIAILITFIINILLGRKVRNGKSMQWNHHRHHRVMILSTALRTSTKIATKIMKSMVARRRRRTKTKNITKKKKKRTNRKPQRRFTVEIRDQHGHRVTEKETFTRRKRKRRKRESNYNNHHHHHCIKSDHDNSSNGVIMIGKDSTSDIPTDSCVGKYDSDISQQQQHEGEKQNNQKHDSTSPPLTTNVARRVEALDPITKKRIHSFVSCSEAARSMNINRTKMSRTCRAGGGLIGKLSFQYAEMASSFSSVISSSQPPSLSPPLRCDLSSSSLQHSVESSSTQAKTPPLAEPIDDSIVLAASALLQL